MKVLDPQSALLPTVEVHQFLQTHRTTQPQRQQGSYPQTNLAALDTIRKDFAHYADTTAAHVTTLNDTATWLPGLLARVKPFGLTKTEVLNLLNVGVGTGVETDEIEADTLLGRDVAFFKVVVEEVEERFDDARVEEVVAVFREVMQANQK